MHRGAGLDIGLTFGMHGLFFDHGDCVPFSQIGTKRQIETVEDLLNAKMEIQEHTDTKRRKMEDWMIENSAASSAYAKLKDDRYG